MSLIRQRQWRALVVGAVLLVLAPLASGAAAATTPPAPQDTTAFCAGGPTGNPFPDVTDSSDPHYANIACAKDAGVVQGKTDGLYHPNDNTSRAQMASLVAREADEMVALAASGKTLTALPAAGSNPFVDVGDPPSNGGPSTAPHTNNILRLVAAGITNGTDSTHYSPANNINRFQMAKFEVSKLEFVTGTTLDASCGATFPDGAEADATFGSFVEKAACAGIIQGKADGSFHGGDPLTRAQTATFEIRGLAWAQGMGFITPLHASSGVTAQSTAFSDVDQSGALSKNDTITITFANPVALSSSITLKDADNTTAVLTDDPGHPATETTSTFTLDSSKKVLTITPTETVKATGGDNFITGTVTITGASGIKDASSGDAWDPTKDTQSHVQFTIPAAVGTTGVVTFVDTVNKTYRFSPDGGGAEQTVVYKSTDTFTDDGSSATIGKFETDLSVGDTIKFTKDTPSAGLNKHDLTNKTPASFTSGTVGNVDTAAHTFVIIDPVSGVTLSDSKAYNGSLFSVNGTAATQAQFEAAINEGDTVVITAGTGGNPSTYALTDATVSGTVSTVNTLAHFVTIGNLGDDPTGPQDAGYDYSLANTTRTIDGNSATVAQFDAALNSGDSLTYTRVNNAGVGTQTFALTNHAPAPISGTVTETHDPATNTATVVNGATRTAIDYTGVTVYKVDGVSSTEAEFEAKITAGDSLLFQAADAQTSTTGSVSLTNSVPDKTVTGHIAPASIDTAGHTYDVVNDAGGIIYDNLPYAGAGPADFGGLPTQRYFVKSGSGAETEVTLVQFDQYLNKIKAATNPTANITTGLNASGTAIEHHLTTDQTIP